MGLEGAKGWVVTRPLPAKDFAGFEDGKVLQLVHDAATQHGACSIKNSICV